jgi:hypothetical protein
MSQAFKTPIKSVQQESESEVEEMMELMVTQNLYKRKVSSDAKIDRLRGKMNDIDFLVGVINNIEEKLEEESQRTVLTDAITQQMSKRI